MASVLEQMAMPSTSNCDPKSLTSIGQEYTYAAKVTKYYGDRYDNLTAALNGLGIINNLLEEISSNSKCSKDQMEKVEESLKNIEDEQFKQIKNALISNITSVEDIITKTNAIIGILNDDIAKLNAEAKEALESHNKSYDIQNNLMSMINALAAKSGNS